MRVLVLLELGADVRVPPERDPRSGWIREDWLVRETDPASARALELGLQLKAARPATEITLIHLGPPNSEPWLRQALARGCDRVLRVWDAAAANVRAPGKAVVLAAAARTAGFDLVLTGAAGVINGDGQLGVLVAAQLGVPCVTQVVDLILREGAEAELSRGLDRGFRERVEASLPLVATVSAGVAATEEPASQAIPASALLAAQGCEIPVWDLADLGVPLEQVRRADRPLNHGLPRPARPKLHRIAAPDPALPAFERILKLVQGSVQRREGRIVQKPADEIVEVIFLALKEEGWLDHLRSGDSRGVKGPEADGRQ